MMSEGIGDFFQKETKYARDHLPGGALDWSARPDLYKKYSKKDTIALHIPENPPQTTLHSTLEKRKSVRTFTDTPLTKEQLSYLLWASTGIQRREGGHEYRTAPSAGGLYPIETYLIAHNVNGVPGGVYHYYIKEHFLEQIATGDFREDIRLAALYQEMCFHAPVVFVWSATFYRAKWKYHQRAYRYIYLDAGHIAENLALAATALGLGSCQIGALFDDEVNVILGVDGIEESTIYMSVVGEPKK